MQAFPLDMLREMDLFELSMGLGWSNPMLISRETTDGPEYLYIKHPTEFQLHCSYKEWARVFPALKAFGLSHFTVTFFPEHYFDEWRTGYHTDEVVYIQMDFGCRPDPWPKLFLQEFSADQQRASVTLNGVKTQMKLCVRDRLRGRPLVRDTNWILTGPNKVKALLAVLASIQNTQVA